MRKIIICALAMLLSLVSLFMALGENAPSAALVMEQAVLTGAQPALIQTMPVVERPAATTLSLDASAPETQLLLDAEASEGGSQGASVTPPAPTAEEPASEAAGEPAQQTAAENTENTPVEIPEEKKEEPAAATPEGPAQEITVQPAEEAAPEINEEITQEPVVPQEPVQETTEAPVLEAVEAPAEEPAAEAAGEQTGEAAIEIAVEPTEEPTNEISEEPAGEATEEPSGEITSEPTEEATEEPAEVSAEATTEEVSEEPGEETAEEPTVEPIGELTEEPAERPAEELPEETAGGPAEDSADQPAEEIEGEDAQTEAASSEDEWIILEYAILNGETEVREQPDLESKVIKTLKGETRVAVLEKLKESAWVKILLDSQSAGYIPASSIRQPTAETTVPAEESKDAADESAALNAEEPMQEAPDETVEALEPDEAEAATEEDALPPQDEQELTEIDDAPVPQGAGEEGTDAPETDDIFVNEDSAPASSAPVRKVTVYTSLGSSIKLGDTIYLTARLEGFEDCGELMYQWECNKGSGFLPVEGATSLTTSYIATAESLSWAWRLRVLYK